MHEVMKEKIATEYTKRVKKLMNINRWLHSRSNVARFYIPRKQGGQPLISIEERVMKEKSLQNHLMNSEEPFMKIDFGRESIR